MKTVDPRRQHGIALIELMIGLVIGLLTTLAITQVLALSGRQQRNVMSGEDAQISGALALHALQRDIKQAGYGIANNPLALGCPLNGDDYNAVALPASLAPFLIQDAAGVNGEDSITIFSSTKQGASVPLLVTENHLQTDTTNAFVVKSTFSAATGDYMIAAPASWDAANGCTVFKVTGILTATDVDCTDGGGVACTKIGHDSTLAASYFPSAGYPSKSYLLNLGSVLLYRTYAITNHVLQMAELGGSAKDAFPEIVNLQAFYAVDDNNDGVVDTYTTTTPTDADGWKKVLGARVAVVSRSTHYEKNAVTTAAPEWDLGTAADVSGATTTACTSGSGGKCVSLPLSQLSDWQHYRYKVFDTMIPLRNGLWNS